LSVLVIGLAPSGGTPPLSSGPETSDAKEEHPARQIARRLADAGLVAGRLIRRQRVERRRSVRSAGLRFRRKYKLAAQRLPTAISFKDAFRTDQSPRGIFFLNPKETPARTAA